MFLIILNYLHYIDVDRRIVIFVIAELIIIYLYLIIYFPLNLQTLFIKTAYCLHLFCLSVPFSIQFWPTCVRYCLEISGVRINVETRSAKPRVKRLSTARVASPQLEKIEVWRDARSVRPLKSALFRRTGGGGNEAPRRTNSRGDRSGGRPCQRPNATDRSSAGSRRGRSRNARRPASRSARSRSCNSSPCNDFEAERAGKSAKRGLRDVRPNG